MIHLSLEVLLNLISYLICSAFLISSQRAESLLVSEMSSVSFAFELVAVCKPNANRGGYKSLTVFFLQIMLILYGGD